MVNKYNTQDKIKIINKIIEIEYQMLNIKEMIKNNKSFDKLLTQIQFTKNELHDLSKAILEKHINDNVVEEIKIYEKEVVEEILCIVNKILSL